MNEQKNVQGKDLNQQNNQSKVAMQERQAQQKLQDQQSQQTHTPQHRQQAQTMQNQGLQQDRIGRNQNQADQANQANQANQTNRTQANTQSQNRPSGQNQGETPYRQGYAARPEHNQQGARKAGQPSERPDRQTENAQNDQNNIKDDSERCC